MTRKFNIVHKAGGKCVICGYKRNLAALAFHHINEKNVSLSGPYLIKMSVARAEQELNECALVCHNCHCEIHHPELSLKKITQMCQMVNAKKLTQEEAYAQFFKR